ncbi:MAG: ATP-binding protein, partial [Alphaproteobacteria bacterium]
MLSLNLSIIQSQLSPESITKISSRIEDSQKLLEETIERIRDVMAELRPPVLDDYGLMATLRWYGERFSKQTNMATIIQGEELTPRLPAPVEIILFRIAQEALTNVAKHAHAKTVTVRLEELEDSVRLTIADDGVGFDHQTHHQQGAKPEWG